MPSSELDLEAIRACHEATVGDEWEVGANWVYCLPLSGRATDALLRVDTVRENAEFIVRARADVPALLEEIARLRHRVDELTGQIKDRDETIQRVLDVARQANEDFGLLRPAQILRAVHGDPADDGSQTDG